MVTGYKKQANYLKSDEILDRTNGGYDVYRYYEGKVGRLMKRPWGHDKKLSWGIFPVNGIWYWKDQATEEAGTAIQYVQRKFNGLSFTEACQKICQDFGFTADKELIVASVVTWDAPDTEEEEYVRINFSSQPFKKYHHDFWNVAFVTEEHCKKMECWAVKDAAIKGKRVKILRDEPVFAYYAPEEDSVKLYFPLRSKEWKFRNNASYRYLWNYERIADKRWDKLLIQKSYKDLLVSTMYIPNVIATQAEHEKIFDADVVGRVSFLSDDVYLAYGSDQDGMTKALNIQKERGYKLVYPDRTLLPDINDFYSFAAVTKDENAVVNLLKQHALL